MPTAIFCFGEHLEHECQIVCGYFGNERYFVDGALVHKHFSLSPSGSREFAARGHQLRVEIAINFKQAEARAFVDDVLVADDLFSEFNAKLTGMRKKRPFLLWAAIWFILTLVFFTVFKAFNAAT